MVESSSLSKAERVRRTFAGNEVDRVPISFWHHFPNVDRTIEGLVDSTLAFQSRYDLDLIKLMPTGMYSIVDYGATIALRDDDVGTTRLDASPISSPDDWKSLKPATVNRGILAEQVAVVRLVREAVGPDVPVIQTIFSPITMAEKLAGAHLIEHIEQAEDVLHEALNRFAEDVIAFSRACLDAGADGFFFATQQGSQDNGIANDAFKRVATDYDIRILSALAEDERNWATVLHIHGPNPRFELADMYPIAAVNWHDRETSPSIAEAVKLTKRGMVAGIDRRGAISGDDAEGTVREIHDAIRQAAGQRLLVAPGCVMPSTVREATLSAARRAVNSIPAE